MFYDTSEDRNARALASKISGIEMDQEIERLMQAMFSPASSKEKLFEDLEEFEELEFEENRNLNF